MCPPFSPENVRTVAVMGLRGSLCDWYYPRLAERVRSAKMCVLEVRSGRPQRSLCDWTSLYINHNLWAEGKMSQS